MPIVLGSCLYFNAADFLVTQLIQFTFVISGNLGGFSMDVNHSDQMLWDLQIPYLYHRMRVALLVHKSLLYDLDDYITRWYTCDTAKISIRLVVILCRGIIQIIMVTAFHPVEWRIYASINQPSLVQIMACHLTGAEPIFETMMEYC